MPYTLHFPVHGLTSSRTDPRLPPAILYMSAMDQDRRRLILAGALHGEPPNDVVIGDIGDSNYQTVQRILPNRAGYQHFSGAHGLMNPVN